MEALAGCGCGWLVRLYLKRAPAGALLLFSAFQAYPQCPILPGHARQAPRRHVSHPGSGHCHPSERLLLPLGAAKCRKSCNLLLGDILTYLNLQVRAICYSRVVGTNSSFATLPTSRPENCNISDIPAPRSLFPPPPFPLAPPRKRLNLQMSPDREYTGGSVVRSGIRRREPLQIRAIPGWMSLEREYVLANHLQIRESAGQSVALSSG